MNFRSRAGAFPLRRYEPEGDGAEPRPSGQAAPSRPPSPQDSLSRSRGRHRSHGRVPGQCLSPQREAGYGAGCLCCDRWGFRDRRRRCWHRRIGKLGTNPEYVYLRDAGEALKVAVEDGNSRFGRASGNGYGIGQVFRALANHRRATLSQWRPLACGSRP